MKLVVVLLMLLSINTYAEISFKGFAEPYMEKSVSAKSQKIGNVSSQYGDASAFSIGTRLGIESTFGLLAGIGFDYTSVIVTNANSSNSSYNLAFQSLDIFIGMKFLENFRLTYSRSVAGKESAIDGGNRDVSNSSNKISVGYLLNKKTYIEISRSEKLSELATANSSVASRADVYDNYSIGLTYPIELF